MWLRYAGAGLIRRMHILLIEDEIAVARQLGKALESRCAASIDIAYSREAAIDLATSDIDYDFIVCDLRIPTSNGALDPSVDHGLYVHQVLRERLPGTPCMLFSGYATLENVRRALTGGPTVDLYGTREEHPLVDVRLKREQPELLKWASEIASELHELDNLEVESAEDIEMTQYKARPLRVFARRLGGTRIGVSALGGMSGASVFRCEVFDSLRSTRGLVVAKVDLISEVESEINGYRNYVVPSVEIGAFAPLADVVLHGCGRYGAAFYKLAANGYKDLFDFAANSVSEAAVAVRRLKDTLNRWGIRGPQSTVSIGDLRAARVSDTDLAVFAADLDEIGWRGVEAVRLTMSQAVQHGDLHGRNVLIDVEGRPLIIDYGDVGLSSALLDAVTLELSLLFHSEHPDRGGWPTLGQAHNWFHLEEYVRESPVREIVIACREWALSAGTRLELVLTIVETPRSRSVKIPTL